MRSFPLYGFRVGKKYASPSAKIVELLVFESVILEAYNFWPLYLTKTKRFPIEGLI